MPSLFHHPRWLFFCLLACAIVGLPLVFILGTIFTPSDAGWEHIRTTLLGDYFSNTILLMLMVAVMTAIIGVSTAWLTAALEFPGRRILSWALILPLAAPAYIVAYVYTDLLDFSGPVQSAFRSLSGLGAGEYSFPQIRSLGGAALIISLVLYRLSYPVYARTASGFGLKDKRLL